MSESDKQNEKHSPESVYRTFMDIDNGLFTNASFSHANVVMVSRELYATLGDAYDRLTELGIKLYDDTDE